MINFYCVLVKPNYTIKHVEALYDQLTQYLSYDFTLTCLTDSTWNTDRPIVFVDVSKYELDTWWNKILCFNKQICSKDVNVYMDLDVLILKNINFVVDEVEKGQLKIVDTVWKNKRWWSLVDNLDVKNKSSFFCDGNSSIMGWVGDSHHFLYEKLFDDIFKHTSEHFGDDTFISQYANAKRYSAKIMTTTAKRRVRLADERILIHHRTIPTV